MTQKYELHIKRNEVLTEVLEISDYLDEDKVKNFEDIIQNSGSIAYIDTLLGQLGIKILSIKSVYNMKA